MDGKIKELLEYLSENINCESNFLYPNPQPFFQLDCNEAIEKIAEIFKEEKSDCGKLFNDIMDLK